MLLSYWQLYIAASFNDNLTTMNYELKVTETGRKGGKFHYQVIDETGKVISERKSNREYVACTINGAFYFGRLDLIGKGDHGKDVKYQVANNLPQAQIAYKR